MGSKLDVIKIPWDSKAVKSGDREELETYLKKLVITLQRIQDGTVNIANLNVESTTVLAGIIASTTQTQGQILLLSGINEISVVANVNDVVTLRLAEGGMRIVIINNGANTLQIFPSLGDDLGAGVDASTTLASGSNIEFAAYNMTNWETL